MKFIFACDNCRVQEIKRVTAILKDKNKGKGKFSRTEKMNVNPDNFMREASEVIFLKNSQVDQYSKISKNEFRNNAEYESHGNTGIKDGWKFKCSFCNFLCWYT